MKPVFSKTTDKVLLIAKLSDDRMKLFLDADPVIQEETAPAPPAGNPEAPQTVGGDQAVASQQAATGSEAAPVTGQASTEAPAQPQPPPRKVVIIKTVTRDDILNALAEFIKPELLNSVFGGINARYDGPWGHVVEHLQGPEIRVTFFIDGDFPFAGESFHQEQQLSVRPRLRLFSLRNAALLYRFSASKAGGDVVDDA